MNLKTIIFVFGALVLLTTLASGQSLPYNKLDKLKVNDLVAKKLEVQSTTQSSLPCPSMTQVQRNAIATPSEGSCVYNSDTNVLNIYDGSAWVEVGSGGGGGGGIANWETAKFYEVGDVVIESNKIYQANTQHTSSVFASDIAYWTQIANNVSDVTGVLPMANGGTDKNLTPVLGGVVYTDAGSMEILGAGTTGQFLKSNGGAAPSWEDVVVNDSSFSGLLSLSKGGTNKNLSAEDGAILYLDADSVEKLSPGTSGQVLQSNGSGAPSFVNKSISAKSENGSSVTLEEIQVNNNQLTQTDANKHLIESGNNNILVNPSFEHSTFSTGWTNTNGVFAEDTIVELHGKKAAKVTLTAQALSLHQDSTLYQAQFADGVQGLAYARVKTSVAGVRLCARKAGANQTSLCMTHSGSGKWELLKVPFILGGTSNGLSINTASNVTGTVLVDDAFVGPVDLKVDTNNISNWTTGTCTGTWSNTTYDCKYMRYGDTMKLQVKATVTGAVSGNLSIGVPSGFTIDTSKIVNTSIQLPMGTGSFWDTSASQDYAIYPLYQNSSLLFIAYSTSVNTGVAALSSSAPVAIGVGDVVSIMVDIPIVGWASSGSIYSSTNADTDWQTCTFASTSWQGLGTVSANAKCKRQGSDLLVRGDVTIGTVSSSTAQIPLPLFNGQSLTIADNSKNVNGLTAGRLYRYVSTNGFSKDAVLLAASSVGYLGISFAMEASTYNPLVPQTGVNLFGNNEYLMYEYRVPIQGWENSNIIIGQFNGLESCANTLQCTDTFSAYVGPTTGPVSQENVDWINGNASVTDTSLFTLTLNTGIFTQIPNCTIGLINNDNTVSVSHKIVTLTNTTIAIRTGYSNTANGFVKASDIPFLIICQKQGADYIGRTARAVASDQNVRSVGSVGVDIQSVYFGSSADCSTACTTGTCTICNRVGTKITSVTWKGTGNYWLDGIDGSKYNCSGASGSAANGTLSILQVRPTTTTAYANIFSGVGTTTANAQYASVTCIGIP